VRKLESGKLKTNHKQGDIVKFLKFHFESFNYLAERHHISFSTAFNKDSFICKFDHDMIEKIAYNLLSNSFKYTPDKGEISIIGEIFQSNKHDAIAIEVTDSGIGISSEDLPHIFDRFYQISNTSQIESKLVSDQKRQVGTGIGLSLVKDLVELLGGKIFVQSKPGKFTTFTVEIPLKKADKKKDSTSPIENTINKYPHITNQPIETKAEKEINKENRDHAPLLLIIDDNPDLRYFLSSSLMSDYNIIEATNGQDGLTEALNHIPDIIICDIMMPVMDGMDFLKNVKEDIRTSHIPVIMLTAKSSEQTQVTGLGTGADDYITKPFNLTLLEAKIKSLLINRKKIKQLYVNSEGTLVAKEGKIYDPQFIERVNEIINKNFSDPAFEIELLAKELAVSNSQLYRKLNAVSNKSFMELLREKRIREAVKLMKSGNHKIKELAYMTGFTSPEYFSKTFKKVIKMTPREYIKELN
jgi:DNA-binding response OmpR family regulator